MYSWLSALISSIVCIILEILAGLVPFHPIVSGAESCGQQQSTGQISAVKTLDIKC